MIAKTVVTTFDDKKVEYHGTFTITTCGALLIESTETIRDTAWADSRDFWMYAPGEWKFVHRTRYE